jgi:hypothetical protein
MATKYRVQGPDGEIHVFEGPDDATPSQIEAFAAQTFGAAPKSNEGMPAARAQAAPAPQGYDFGRTVDSLIPSLYQNTVGGLVNLVSSPVQSAQALGDVVAGGAYNLMPAPIQRGLTAIEQSKYNPLGNPQALQRAQNVAGAVGQDYARTYGTGAGFQQMMEEDPFRVVGDVSMLLGGSGAALRAGTTGAKSATVANALTRGSELTNPINLLARPAAAMISPNVDPNVRALMAEGITPTTGQILGGGFKRAEEGLSSVPILGDFIKSAQIRAVEGLNRAAINRSLKPIGDALPADLKGRDAVTYASDKLDNAYGTLLPKMTVLQDAPFQNEIFNLKSMVDNGAIHQASKDFFSKWLDNNVLSKFQGQGAVTGDTLKGIETNLRTTIEELSKSTNFDEQKIGTALKETQDQLRQLVIRNNPQFAKELKAIDTGYANFKRVEKAAGLVGSEEGVFSPSQLQSAVRATDRSKDKGQFATGNALMQDLSETGKTVLGNKLPDSGTPYRGMLPLLLGGGAGAAGYPALAAGMLAGPALYSAPGQRMAATLLTQRPAGANALANQFRGNDRAKLAALMANQAGNTGNQQFNFLSGQ